MNYTEEEVKSILINTADEFQKLGMPFRFLFFESDQSGPTLIECGSEPERMEMLEFLLEHDNNQSLEKTNEIISLKKQIELLKSVN